MAVQQLANSILEPERIRMAVSALSVKELIVKKLSWRARVQKGGQEVLHSPALHSDEQKHQCVSMNVSSELATFLGRSCIAFFACSIGFLCFCIDFEAAGGRRAPKGAKGIP